MIKNNSDDDTTNILINKISNNKEGSPNKKHQILCQKQSYIIESFDGGQTLRED